MSEPSIQQLRYAVAVADHANFGRAAAACFVSQPALSAQIRLLEAKLGVALFERTTRQVVVTTAGTDVVARARDVLARVDELVQAARCRDDPLSGELRLGVIPTIAPYLLPGVVARARTEFPSLELYLREDRTDDLLHQLSEGRLELLLLALPVDRPQVATLQLLDEPFVVAVGSGHRLAGLDRVGLSDLAGERLVLLEEGHCLRDQALDVCDLAGVRGSTQIQSTSLGTVVQMVGGGMGATLLPLSAVATEVHAADPVTVCRLAGASAGRTLGLAWRSSSPRADGFRRFGELVRHVGQGVVDDALDRLHGDEGVEGTDH